MSQQTATAPLAIDRPSAPQLIGTQEAAQDAADAADAAVGGLLVVSRCGTGFRWFSSVAESEGWLVSVKVPGKGWVSFQSQAEARHYADVADSLRIARNRMVDATLSTEANPDSAKAALETAAAAAAIVTALRHELDALTPAPRF